MTLEHSYPIGKTRCPMCAKLGKDTSHDNLIQYSDSHQYCFGCGYHIPASGVGRIKAHLEAPPSPVEINLPQDVTLELVTPAKEWISKYNLTEQEIRNNLLMWSESKQMLVFPYFGEEHALLGWQGRYFGNNPKHPKWYSKGPLKEIFHIIGFGVPIVCVEDVVSAIKVGRVVRSLPIFGSHVGLERLLRLSKLTNEVSIWLDSDKRRESIVEASRGSSIGLRTRSIYTEFDPKEYDTEQIKEILK